MCIKCGSLRIEPTALTVSAAHENELVHVFHGPAAMQQFLSHGLHATRDRTAFHLLPQPVQHRRMIPRALIDELLQRLERLFKTLVPLVQWLQAQGLAIFDGADLALGYFPAVLADLTAKAQSGEAVAFAHHRLYGGEYVCVMRRGHPLAQKNITLEEFCNSRHLLVSFSGRPYGFIDEALASIGKQRRVVMTVNQFFTAGRMVVNSDLLTVLPRHFVPTTGIADELFLCELPFKVPTLHVDAVWHRRKHAQNDHIWLREVLLGIAHAAFSGQGR